MDQLQNGHFLLVINIVSTIEPTAHEFMLNNVVQNQPRYMWTCL
jgi:hypothetical protein